MNSPTFLRTVLALGKSLNIPVLAEGIETDQQLQFLAEEGCKEGQGYLMARPIPLEKLADAVEAMESRTAHMTPSETVVLTQTTPGFAA